MLEQAAELGKQKGLQVPDRWWENQQYVFNKTTRPKLWQIVIDILKNENKFESFRTEYNRINGDLSGVGYLFLALVSLMLALVGAHLNTNILFEETVGCILDPLGAKEKMKKFSHWLVS